MHFRASRGFTLIELATVVSILGILALAALPRILPHIAKAKEAVLKQNVHSTQIAVESAAMRLEGELPAGVAVFRSALPDTLGFVDPWTNTRALPIDGTADARGEIGYELVNAERYVITGFGQDDLIITISNGGSVTP